MNRVKRATDLAGSLFEARGADLLGFLRRRVHSDADARDIAQETYLRFIRLADPQRIDNPEAYLFRIAANLLWEHRLGQQRHGDSSDAGDIPQAEPATDSGPLDLAVTEQAARRLKAALSDLPATPRAVLVLRIQHELTISQIAAQIGVSESMIKKHLTTAVAFCRKRLRALESGL